MNDLIVVLDVLGSLLTSTGQHPSLDVPIAHPMKDVKQ